MASLIVFEMMNIDTTKSTTMMTIAAIFREEFTRKGADSKPYAIDGLRNAEWVAMDYADVLVHVFLPETRAFYNLEHLWADAKLTQIPDLD